MAFISRTTISEVNTRLDAISVIGDYVRLEQKSGRWWGRCPFHGGGQEKTPSFKVDPDLKMYHCFGCNKGGSVISFIMEMDKLTYPQTIKHLADKMGIEIIYEDNNSSEGEKDDTLKVELYELYKRLTVTFRHFLYERQGADALYYIKQRGFNDEIIKQFNLGFSPSNRDFLHNFLKQKGYSDEFLKKSGLFSSKYNKIPLFSGRLMFPITDRQGRIVAFGGRALQIDNNSGNTPKYINSPETEIYKKGQTLFAIDNAKSLMRQEKTVYLAEGYMDVIALHQAGITNSVAPLGTAFTDEQALLLRRWAEKVILLLDNDEAGIKAAFKAILTCRKNNISCQIADIQTGLRNESGVAGLHTGKITDFKNLKDPADILKEFGPQILKKVIKFIINDFEYFIFHAKEQLTRTGNINKAAELMYPYLETLDSEIDRSDYITRIADIFKLERNAVQSEFLKWRKNYSHQTRFPVSQMSERRPDDGSSGGSYDAIATQLQVRANRELNLIANIALNMELYPEFRSLVEIKDFDDRAAKDLFISLEECYKYDESGIDSLLPRINDENLKNFVIKRGTSGEFKADPRKFMEDGIKLIKVKQYKKRLTEINGLMRESERKQEFSQLKEFTDIDELLSEKIFIDEQIRKLEGK